MSRLSPEVAGDFKLCCWVFVQNGMWWLHRWSCINYLLTLQHYMEQETYQRNLYQKWCGTHSTEKRKHLQTNYVLNQQNVPRWCFVLIFGEWVIFQSCLSVYATSAVTNCEHDSVSKFQRFYTVATVARKILLYIYCLKSVQSLWVLISEMLISETIIYSAGVKRSNSILMRTHRFAD